MHAHGLHGLVVALAEEPYFLHVVDGEILGDGGEGIEFADGLDVVDDHGRGQQCQLVVGFLRVDTFHHEVDGGYEACQFDEARQAFHNRLVAAVLHGVSVGENGLQVHLLQHRSEDGPGVALYLGAQRGEEGGVGQHFAHHLVLDGLHGLLAHLVAQPSAHGHQLVAVGAHLHVVVDDFGLWKGDANSSHAVEVDVACCHPAHVDAILDGDVDRHDACPAANLPVGGVDGGQSRIAVVDAHAPYLHLGSGQLGLSLEESQHVVGGGGALLQILFCGVGGREEQVGSNNSGYAQQ